MINWNRPQVEGDATADGDASIQVERPASIQALDTLCGTLMSDDNIEFVICDALIISTALAYTGLSSS